MAVSNLNALKSAHAAVGGMSKKAVTSDFSFVIKGFEQFRFLVKQVPWAVLSHGEPMEIPCELGLVEWQPTQAKTHLQGAITMMETEDGMVDNMLISMLMQGGEFDAIVYEGTRDKFTRAKRYTKCHTVMEPADRDWESRQQPLLLSGTLYFHYIGDDIPGNVESLNG